jgi:hypothetical protein
MIFTANLVTAVLVTRTSRFGLLVSTTPVSVGSLFGTGIVNKTANRSMILTILLKPADKSAEILECGGSPPLFIRGQAAR